MYQALRKSVLAWHLRALPGRLRYWKQAPSLSAVEARLVADLKRDGIAVIHLDELFPPKVFAELADIAKRRWQSPAVRRQLSERSTKVGKRLFLVDLWGGKHFLRMEDPFHRVSLSQPMLHIASAYLGMYPKFREFFLEATVPLPKDLGQYSSQRWHADPDDRKMVKTFLYLNDVTEAAGPFTYIKGSHGGGRWRSTFPFHPDQGRHPEPEFVKKMIPSEDVFVATGRAGTIIFCDTSGIHLGGKSKGPERLMYTSVYTSPASALPTRYHYPDSFSVHRIQDPLVRYAVTA